MTVACLRRQRYRRAFEPACGPGLLTELLAARCDAIVAVDVAPGAVAVATHRLAGRPGVEIATMAVPDRWPSGTFDLIVLSEIGYYLQPEALAQLRDAAVGALVDDGELLAVHWRGTSIDHVLHGDEVHQVLAGNPLLRRDLRHVEAGFVLERFVRER